MNLFILPTTKTVIRKFKHTSDAPSATNKERIRNTAFELWLSNCADYNQNERSQQSKTVFQLRNVP